MWQILAGQVLPSFNPASENIFPAPSAIFVTAAQMLRSGELGGDIAASVIRVIAGFLIAACIGVALGLLMAAWPAFGRQLRVVIDVLRPIPPVAWIPFGLLWFGIGDMEAVFVIAIAAIFPILLNTVAGIEAVESVVQRSGQCLGARGWRLFYYVILPRATPQIVVGLRIGLGIAWFVLVAAELIGSTSGLGYLILNSRNQGIPSLALTGMIVIGIIGYLLDVFIRQLEKRLLPWHS